MNEKTVNDIKAALEHSPENIPLRQLLADTLLGLNRWQEAESEYKFILRYSSDPKAKLGMAKIYFNKANYSACIIILEEVLESNQLDSQHLGLYAKALLKENAVGKATEIYQRAQLIDPDYFDEELDNQLKQKTSFEESDENGLDSRFLEKPNVDFSHIGGMDAVKKEIDLKIIKPLSHPELYKAYGKKIGGGILLYGPPGCGKTFLARATAGQVNSKFINVSLNDILDMWIGNSEKNLHEIFELARANNPAVLFIDEIDALGASRSDMKQSSGRHLINQFLQELDGIASDNEGILVLGATNTPWNLDPAFRRPGRFDRIIFVPPPDENTRKIILEIKLKDKPVESIDYGKLAKATENFSGADIEAVIDIAIEAKLESSFEDGIPKPLKTKDLQEAIKKHKPSTMEWFKTARNFAMFANDSGLYDDILSYLKLKK